MQRVLRVAGAKPAPGLLQSVVHADTDSVANATRSHEGTVNGAGSAIDWLARETGLDTTRALGSLAQTFDAAAVPLLFMNGVGGLGAPYWQPDFPVEFVTIGHGSVHAEPHELAQLAAVVESIAFLVAVNIQLLQRSSPLQKIVITGGLASCDYLCQALAEVCGLPVERPALREATARGTAFLAADASSSGKPCRSSACSPSAAILRLPTTFQLWRERSRPGSAAEAREDFAFEPRRTRAAGKEPAVTAEPSPRDLERSQPGNRSRSHAGMIGSSFAAMMRTRRPAVSSSAASTSPTIAYPRRYSCSDA